MPSRILVLALCVTSAVPCVWSRRFTHGNKVASPDVAQQPQDGIGHSEASSTICASRFDNNTQEEALKRHFGAVGAIKDLHSPSKGNALITYENSSAATRAVNELHGSYLEGQTQQVVVKLNDPDRESEGDKGKGSDMGRMDRPPGRTIVVLGLGMQTSDDALTAHFGTVGAIEDRYFQSPVSAVITYVDASSAQQAVTELDGSIITGQTRYLHVLLDDPDRRFAYQPDSSRPTSASGKSRRRRTYLLSTRDSRKGAGTETGRAIYARGFDYGTDQAALEEHFGNIGAIEDCYFQNPFIAVITYVDASFAQRAVTELDGSIMSGQTRWVQVRLDDPDRRCAKRSDSSRPATASGKNIKHSCEGAGTDSGRSIYASGFDYGTDEAALEEHFGKVGTIESYSFQSQGVAVITFVDAASAQQAVTDLDGATMPGRTCHIAVKLATCVQL